MLEELFSKPGVPHRTLYDFQATRPDELTFSANESVLVLKRFDDGWLLGEHEGLVGMFPAKYVLLETMPRHSNTKLSEKKAQATSGLTTVVCFELACPCSLPRFQNAYLSILCVLLRLPFVGCNQNQSCSKNAHQRDHRCQTCAARQRCGRDSASSEFSDARTDAGKSGTKSPARHGSYVGQRVCAERSRRAGRSQRDCRIRSACTEYD